MVDNKLKRFEDETENEYINRICSLKTKNQLTLSWRMLADFLNEQLDMNRSEKWYRTHYYNGDFEVNIENPSPEETMLMKIGKLKVKAADERNQARAYIRRLAREETLKEIAANYASELKDSKPLLTTSNLQFIEDSENSGILLISDWHYGMVCDNYWNKFDPEICRSRVSQLQKKTIELIHQENIHELTVLNLSDLIAGRIHSQIRIESRYNAVQQTMHVAEILAEFLTNLSAHCNIQYYDCLDNHSRVEPDKNDSLDLESFVLMIPWYLKARLQGNIHVYINGNEFGPDIITCTVAGHNIIGVHGHDDSPVTVLDKLSLMTHRHYELMCLAHRHHFQCDEQHQTLIVSNASLMGVDSYSEKHRLTSYPSQTFIKSTRENVCESIHRIVLK